MPKPKETSTNKPRPEPRAEFCPLFPDTRADSVGKLEVYRLARDENGKQIKLNTGLDWTPWTTESDIKAAVGGGAFNVVLRGRGEDGSAGQWKDQRNITIEGPPLGDPLAGINAQAHHGDGAGGIAPIVLRETGGGGAGGAGIIMPSGMNTEEQKEWVRESRDLNARDAFFQSQIAAAHANTQNVIATVTALAQAFAGNGSGNNAQVLMLTKQLDDAYTSKREALESQRRMHEAELASYKDRVRHLENEYDRLFQELREYRKRFITLETKEQEKEKGLMASAAEFLTMLPAMKDALGGMLGSSGAGAAASNAGAAAGLTMVDVGR
jgi:flagellar motility protein MotE (MotC chaperone)